MITLTVYADGIRLSTPDMTVGFYSSWTHYFNALLDWRFDVVLRVRHDTETIYLPG